MHGKLYVSDPKLWEQTFKDMVSGKLNPYQYARSPQTVIYHSIVANIYLLAQLTCRHVTRSNTTGATSGAGTAYLSGSHEDLCVVRVSQSLVLCSVLSDHCLSYCSVVHCVICSLIYGF
jgi:hypothetical protein